MVDIRCRVIPEPKAGTRVVLKATGKGQYFKTGGNDTYHCGKCNFVLAINTDAEQIRNQYQTEGGEGIVLVCPECNSCNELGPDIC